MPPAVARDPVLGAVASSPQPATEIELLQRLHGRRVAVHAALVLQQVVGNGDRTGDRTTGVDLCHHVLLATDASVLVHVVLGEVLDGWQGVS